MSGETSSTTTAGNVEDSSDYTPLIIGVVIASAVAVAALAAVAVVVVVRWRKRKEAEKKEQYEKRLQMYEALPVESNSKNCEKKQDACGDIYDKPMNGVDNFGMIPDEGDDCEKSKDRRGGEIVTKSSSGNTPARKVKLSERGKDARGANLYAVVSIYCEENAGGKTGITGTHEDGHLSGNSPDSDSGISDITSVNKETKGDSSNEQMVTSCQQPKHLDGTELDEAAFEPIYFELEKELDGD